MKDIIKKILGVALIVLTLFLEPVSVWALSIEKDYHPISESTQVVSDNIVVENITFINNNATTTTPSFGLTGIVKNKSTFSKNVEIIASFYNQEHSLIIEKTTPLSLVDNYPTTYNDMIEYTSLPSGYNVSDLKYYILTVKETPLAPSAPINTLHQQSRYATYPYLIDTYDIKVNVNSDNTYDITETIMAYFNEERHGIYRNIPTINNIIRQDGTTAKNYAKISNIKVNEKFAITKSDNNYQIKIGDKNRLVTGQQEYVISYHYDLGKDQSKNFDEVYLNLIGSDWDTAIGYITFEITMPKDFPTEKLGFAAGKRESLASDSITWERTGNKIFGTYKKPLEKGEALTFRLALEEGYFELSPFLQGIDYLLFFIPLVCLIICIAIWNKYGKDDKYTEVINFYPPQNLNSLDIALNYKGEASERAIISLLVYLANKGYIEIEEEKFSKYSRNDFSIRKIKDYDGTNIHEKMFLEGLFKCKRTGKRITNNLSEREKVLASESNVVTSTDLQYKFHTTIGKIKRNINAKKNTKKIFVKGTNRYNWLIIVLIVLTYFFSIGVPTYLYSTWEEVAITLIISAMYLPFLVIATSPKLTRSIRIGLLIFIILHFAMISIVLPLSTAITANFLYASALLFSVICLTGMIICLNNMPKRTPYGNEMLGQIQGFKTFLETAEKEKLESLVEENPNYFYDILPYTYVLGVSRKWINKFETILLQEPSWYKTSTNFNVVSFGHRLNKTISDATLSSVSSISSSTSSSSTGGGISGGGSGGGGGGSW